MFPEYNDALGLLWRSRENWLVKQRILQDKAMAFVQTRKPVVHFIRKGISVCQKILSKSSSKEYAVWVASSLMFIAL